MSIVKYGHNIDITKIKNTYYTFVIKLLLEQDVNNRTDSKSFFNELLNYNHISFKINTEPISIPIKYDNDDNDDNDNKSDDSNNNSPLFQPSSAPLNTYVMTSYLDTKTIEVDSTGLSMPMYGSSPPLRKKSDFQHILNQSAKSISNFFNFKL